MLGIYHQLRNAGVNLDIFELALEFPKGNFMIQPRTMVWNNTVSSPGSPSDGILKKAERHTANGKRFTGLNFHGI